MLTKDLILKIDIYEEKLRVIIQPVIEIPVYCEFKIKLLTWSIKESQKR